MKGPRAQELAERRDHDKKEDDGRHGHRHRLQVRARHAVITQGEEDPEHNRGQQGSIEFIAQRFAAEREL